MWVLNCSTCSRQVQESRKEGMKLWRVQWMHHSMICSSKFERARVHSLLSRLEYHARTFLCIIVRLKTMNLKTIDMLSPAFWVICYCLNLWPQVPLLELLPHQHRTFSIKCGICAAFIFPTHVHGLFGEQIQRRCPGCPLLWGIAGSPRA